MPQLDPIVVNEPKVQETYTFSKEDIKRIIQEAINNGQIKVGSELYLQKFNVKYSNQDYGHYEILTKVKTQFTTSTLAKWLYDNNYRSRDAGLAETIAGQYFLKQTVVAPADNNTFLVQTGCLFSDDGTTLKLGSYRNTITYSDSKFTESGSWQGNVTSGLSLYNQSVVELK